ncbi:MAG: HEAT repeat domain-containing protein [Anaerohalosphaeraceae bacterium]
MKKGLLLFGLLTIGLAAVRIHSFRSPLQFYWHHWSGIQKFFVIQDKEIRFRFPLLSRSVARSDPEAADITEWLFLTGYGRLNYQTYEDIEALAALAEQYPDNPFLLYSLGCRLSLRAYIDPHILRRLAERLEIIAPENPRRFLLLALADFADRKPDSPERAVSQLEQCFAGPYPPDPYAPYLPRICRLLEAENPLLPMQTFIALGQIEDVALLRRLLRGLLERTEDMIGNGQIQRALSLHDRIQKIAENSIPPSLEYPWANFTISWEPAGLLLKKTPQSIELQRLGPEFSQRLRQNRLQILAWLIQSQNSKSPHHPPKEPYPDYSEGSVYWLPLAGHTFQMSWGLGTAVLLFFTVAVFGKWKRPALSGWPLLWTAAAFFLYFLFCRGPEIFEEMTQSEWCCDCFRYHYQQIPSSLFIWDLLKIVQPFAVYSLAVFGFLTVIAYGLFRKKPRLWRRLFLQAAGWAAAVSALLVWKAPFAATVFFDFLTAMALIPLAALPSRQLDSKPLFFASSEAGREYRSRCAILAFFAWTLHLFFFTLAVPALAQAVAVQAVNIKHENTWLAGSPAPYRCDPNLYPAFLEAFKTNPPSNFEATLLPHLALIEPNDLPAVLSAFQERDRQIQSDPNRMYPPEEDPFRWQRRLLIRLHHDIRYCGKDAWPAILPFIQDPNQRELLLAEYHSNTPEGRRRFVRMLRQQFNPADPPLKHQMEALTQAEKGEWIEEWLRQNEKTLDYSQTDCFLKVRAQLSEGSRRRLWQEWIKALEDSAREKIFPIDLTLLEHPAEIYEIPDDLLERCLQADNPRLRAFGFHLWRCSGKALDEPLLRRMAEDPHPFIRAAAAAVSPQSISPDDPSPLVRLTAKLTAQAPAKSLQ